MKPINVLITGAGAPGIQGTIHSVRENYDRRQVHITGTDINEEVVGKYLCDAFFKIPKAKEQERYLETMLRLAVSQKIDVIMPQNTAELLLLAQNKSLFTEKGIGITVADAEPIRVSNNKFELMEICSRCGVPVGTYFLASNQKQLRQAAETLGWPAKQFVVKPPVSNGQRGIRIIDEKFSPRDMFYDEKPNSLFTNMHELERILGESFPELIVTEYLSGDEYTIDILRTPVKTVIIPRKRELIRSGITFNASLEKNEVLIKASEILATETGLTSCFGFQFKLDDNGVPKILESNPRIQGTMVMSTLAGANIIYSAVKYALGESIPDFDIDWNTKLLRYWGGIAYSHEKVTHI
jgi:carbamoyl-phosphate synthase large subunit